MGTRYPCVGQEPRAGASRACGLVHGQAWAWAWGRGPVRVRGVGLVWMGRDTPGMHAELCGVVHGPYGRHMFNRKRPTTTAPTTAPDPVDALLAITAAMTTTHTSNLTR
jgi:hypothetical protein